MLLHDVDFRDIVGRESGGWLCLLYLFLLVVLDIFGGVILGGLCFCRWVLAAVVPFRFAASLCVAPAPFAFLCVSSFAREPQCRDVLWRVASGSLLIFHEIFGRRFPRLVCGLG